MYQKRENPSVRAPESWRFISVQIFDEPNRGGRLITPKRDRLVRRHLWNTFVVALVSEYTAAALWVGAFVVGLADPLDPGVPTILRPAEEPSLRRVGRRLAR